MRRVESPFPAARHDSVAAKASAAIKTADVYCDTSPWGGVRGTIAAMRAALPIVAFADVAFASEALKGIAPIAVDEIEYRNIALSYLSDPKARRRDGRRLQQRARANFDATAATARLVAQIDAAYARKAAAPA